MNTNVNFVSEESSGKTQNNLKVQKNAKSFKKQKLLRKNRLCFHCGKKGHYIRECRYRNAALKLKEGSENAKANLIEGESKELVAMMMD